MTVQTMPAPTALTCPRDETATRLTCSGCGTPICPSCLMRTAVGMRCPGCAVGTPARPSSRKHGRIVRVAAAVAAVAAVAGGLSLRDGDSRPAEEVVEAVAGTPTAALGGEVTVGRFAVTVTSFDCTGQPIEAAPAGPGKSCIAQLSIRNDGLQTSDFATSLQRVTDGVRRFGPTGTGAAGGPLVRASSRDLPPVAVNPGVVVETAIEFRMPETLEPSRLELRFAPRGRPVPVALPA